MEIKSLHTKEDGANFNVEVHDGDVSIATFGDVSLGQPKYFKQIYHKNDVLELIDFLKNIADNMKG